MVGCNLLFVWFTSTATLTTRLNDHHVSYQTRVQFPFTFSQILKRSSYCYRLIYQTIMERLSVSLHFVLYAFNTIIIIVF